MTWCLIQMYIKFFNLLFQLNSYKGFAYLIAVG